MQGCGVFFPDFVPLLRNADREVPATRIQLCCLRWCVLVVAALRVNCSLGVTTVAERGSPAGNFNAPVDPVYLVTIKMRNA